MVITVVEESFCFSPASLATCLAMHTEINLFRCSLWDFNLFIGCKAQVFGLIDMCDLSNFLNDTEEEKESRRFFRSNLSDKSNHLS